MKPFFRHSAICTVIGLLVLAVLVAGCTSQPAPAPASPPVTTTPVPAVTAVPSPVPYTLTSTTWNLSWFDDNNGGWSRVAEGSSVFATFISATRVTGSGGCNGFSSDYQVSGGSGIRMTRPEVTDRLCQTPVGVMSQESVFFTDLEHADTYAVTDGQLVIFDKAGRKILQFDPSP
jgi:heat shock protein HslJ